MRSNLFRRIVEYLLVFFVAISLNFLLPRAMPGDPIGLIAGAGVAQMGAKKIAELRSLYGLDQSIGYQYQQYLSNLIQGNLGQSYRFSGGRPVLEVIAEGFGWTFLLVSVSLTLALALGALLGVLSAWHREKPLDLSLVAILFTLRSIPAFWLAMILIPIFAVNLGWLPSGDLYSLPRPEGWAAIQDVAAHAVLPVTVLTLAYLPTIFALTRTSMLDVLNEDYIRTAHAKGLRARSVLVRHAFRNAILPVMTTFAIDFGQLLGGVTLIETVFNYRGIGLIMFEAIKSRDYPLLQGGFLVFTLGVIGLNLLVEWLYPHLDPRARGY